MNKKLTLVISSAISQVMSENGKIQNITLAENPRSFPVKYYIFIRFLCIFHRLLVQVAQITLIM